MRKYTKHTAEEIKEIVLSEASVLIQAADYIEAINASHSLIKRLSKLPHWRDIVKELRKMAKKKISNE